jgi:hypothetical protein
MAGAQTVGHSTFSQLLEKFIYYSNSLIYCLSNLGEGGLSKLAPPSDLCNKVTSIITGQVAGLQVEGINFVLNNFNICSYLQPAICFN